MASVNLEATMWLVKEKGFLRRQRSFCWDFSRVLHACRFQVRTGFEQFDQGSEVAAIRVLDVVGLGLM